METNSFELITSLADKNTLVLTDINGTLTTKIIQPGKELDPTYQLIETQTPSIIKNLQNSGICVMAITMAAAQNTPKTKKRLLDFNIDLSINCLSNNQIAFHLSSDALYDQGILYTGKNPKGEALLYFLDKIHYTPTKILFIDDTIDHIRSVETAAKRLEVAFLGLHYRRL